MITPEERAASDYPKSPWRLIAAMALDEAKVLPETRAIALLCNNLAQAYRQGCEDQKKLDRAQSSGACPEKGEVT